MQRGRILHIKIGKMLLSIMFDGGTRPGGQLPTKILTRIEAKSCPSNCLGVHLSEFTKPCGEQPRTVGRSDKLKGGGGEDRSNVVGIICPPWLR